MQTARFWLSDLEYDELAALFVWDSDNPTADQIAVAADMLRPFATKDSDDA